MRLIVPYPPGGGNDTISRLLAPKFTESTGQQLIIDNSGGPIQRIGKPATPQSPRQPACGTRRSDRRKR